MNNPGEKIRPAVAALFALVMVTGCASTRLTNYQSDLGTEEKLPRPNHVWVSDFATTAGEIPSNSALARQVMAPDTPLTAGQLAADRDASAMIASYLVADINDMGLPADRVLMGARMQVNDIVIRGYLLSEDEGSATKRLTIGFGSGRSRLTVAVEGYPVTTNGWRKLVSGTVEANGNKMPGAAVSAVVFLATANPVGLIVGGGAKIYNEASGRNRIEGRAKATAREISRQLLPRFQQQGWIQ